MPNLSNAVLHDDRQLLGHAEDDGGGEGCGLAEGIQVPQGKGELHRLVQVNDCLLLLLVDSCVLSAGDVGAANVPISAELDAILQKQPLLSSTKSPAIRN